MGWTHHWTRPAELPANAFARAAEDCRRAFALIGIPLAGADGEGAPVITDDRIVFNGPAGAGCEPFRIHRCEKDRRGGATTWSFCKTGRAPYDVCVQMALIVLKHHLSDHITVGSDGRDVDWRLACQRCHRKDAVGMPHHSIKREFADNKGSR